MRLASMSQPTKVKASMAAARRAARRETIIAGPTLYILLRPMQCADECQYCQASRWLDDDGFSCVWKQWMLPSNQSGKAMLTC